MSSPTYLRPDDDPEMERAYERARQSFGFFWREMSWEHRRIIPGVQLAAVKVGFAVPEPAPQAPTVEHMWVDEIGFDGRTVTGVLLNTAGYIPGLDAGADISVPFERVEDWMYVLGDAVCGGLTVQETRMRMSVAERADHDAQWGLGFAAPDRVLLTPQQGDGLPYPEALAEARSQEHPMSINSTPSIEQQLSGQPDAARMVLDDGFTLLHVDALGGNLGPVQALLRHGADRAATTPGGDTALDLARRLGWERVVAALAG